MGEPVIHSSNWTGPIETTDPLNNTTATVGGPWLPAEEERVGCTKKFEPASPAVRRWARLVGFVALSPMLLLGSWRFAHAITTDELWSDHRQWLILWGLALIGIAAREIHAGKPVKPRPRSVFLAGVLGLTFGFAVWYPYAVVTAHDGAIASQPERTYELYHSCGKSCGYYVHQRANGTTIEGTWVGDAVAYGTTCTVVQRLDGDRGFSWIRLLDRSPPPEHEIAWPIRREDCFSSKPLSSLKT